MYLAVIQEVHDIRVHQASVRLHLALKKLTVHRRSRPVDHLDGDADTGHSMDAAISDPHAASSDRLVELKGA